MKKLVLILTVLIIASAISCNRYDEKSDAYGNFEATEILVSAQSMGEITMLKFSTGDRLGPGEIVVIVDTTELVLNKKLLMQQKATIGSQLRSLQSEIEVARQQLENAVVNQRRIKNLFDQGAATQKQLDDIDGQVNLAHKQIEAIRSRREAVINQMAGIDVQVEQLMDKIDRCRVKNPEEGTVLVKYAEQGELAAPGKPLYKLANLTKMKLRAYISGDQLAHIKIGQTVEVIYDAGKNENRTIEGKVEWISSSAEFTPKTIQTKEERVNLVYAVKVAVLNDGEIKIGMPGEFNFKPKY